MTERVAITGAGVVTPIGCGYAAFRDALAVGRSGVGPITAFDCAGMTTRIAAEVCDGASALEDWVEPRKATKLMSRAALFAVVAAAMARQHARLGRDAVDPRRLGVVAGAGGMGPTDLDLLAIQAGAVIEAARAGGSGGWDVSTFARIYAERTNPLATLRGLPNLAAAQVAIQNDAQGPNATITTACCAGTQAIGEGLRLIQRGDADVVLAGGTDAAVNPVAVLGFSLIGTLSRRNDEPARASRPFDRDRDGFVIGEGAGFVVLERASFAAARGAPVLAELTGYGVSCDAYRITDERPDAAGAARAVAAVPGRREHAAGRRGLRERARHGHPDERPDRDPGAQAEPRRPGRQRGRQLDQVHDRPPARRGGRGGAGGGRHRDPGGLPAAHHQPRGRRRRVRPRLRAECRPAGGYGRRAEHLVRLRRTERMPGHTSLVNGRAVEELVREIVADVLVIAADDVRPGVALIRDLGAESIDFLDLVFRLEDALETPIPYTRWQRFLERTLAGADPVTAITPEVVQAFTVEEMART